MSGDLIRRQDAIDALKEYEVVESDNFTKTDPITMMTVGTIANCIEAIVDLPSAEPESKWIPVTERLPEEDKDVLVFGVEAISNEYVYGVKRLDVDTWRPIIAPSIRWIAWMPLPEPWKGDHENA